jgi:predicted enzyme related to lactoylglutathione lyase
MIASRATWLRRAPEARRQVCKAYIYEETQMAKNPVAWFEIYVEKMVRAKEFYETVLAAKLERLNDPTDSGMEMWSFPSNMESYGATGALVKMKGFSAGGNSTLVYFACEDCAIEESRVETAGGRIQQSKISIGEYGFISLAIDTEGNMFGLHSQK